MTMSTLFAYIIFKMSNFKMSKFKNTQKYIIYIISVLFK